MAAKQTEIKVKQRRWLSGDIGEVGMRWIEQVVVFACYHDGCYFEYGRLFGFDPPIAEGLRTQIPQTGSQAEVSLGRDVQVIREHGRYRDVVGWEVLPSHMNQILKYGQRNALSHVHYSVSG